MWAVAVLLFAGACVGHTAWLANNINYLFGTRYRGWWVSTLRHLNELVIVVGPLAFLWCWGPQLGTLAGWLSLPAALQVYLCWCWLLGFIYVPLCTVMRWRHRAPMLQSNHTETVDFASILGRRPYGRGKRRLLARLPFNEIFQVDFTEKTLAISGLPAAWEGLSILHVTDLHLCGTPDRVFYERVMERCVEQPADILAFTGDLVDSDWHYRWILPTLGRLRWRHAAFAVLGNHDAWENVPRIRRRIERLGISCVGGEWRQLDLLGERLTVIGNEAPWFRPAPDLTNCPADAFRLCLSHSPDTIRWAQRHRVNLMLAGHNHGGQIRFPVVGPVLVPSKFGRQFDCGLFYRPPTVMHVGRGLGGTYPLRYNCRPEVTRLILRSASRTDGRWD